MQIVWIAFNENGIMPDFRNIILLSLLAIAYVQLCIGQHCPSCPLGRFAVRNCSQLDVVWKGRSCSPCSDCLGEGKIIFSSCSTFSDTVCRCKDGYDMASTGDCQKHVPVESLGSTQPSLESVECMRSIVIVILPLVVLVFIISILSMALICLRQKIYKKGAHQKLPQSV
ncbi:hypothetical protein J4Q44_G00105380 [Coregonus suidteri]|uniref:TNFR-Cys domain-containing protein n=1 Tax=Coregonus suidteri TaxID=861788 RepID=A0AAN8RA52_9TELE